MRKLFLLLALLCCAAANAKPDEAAIMSHQAARLTVGQEKGGEKHVLLEAGGRSLALTLKANDALLAQVDTITRGKAAGAGNEFLAGAIDTGYLERHRPATLMGDEETGHPRWRTHALVAALADQAGRRASTTVLPGLPSGWRTLPSQDQCVTYAAGSEDLTVRYRFDRSTLHATVHDWQPEVHLLSATSELVDAEIEGVRRRYRITRCGNIHYVDSALGATALKEIERFPDPSSVQESGSLLAPMPGSVVRIEVADNGPGIPLAEQARIFEKFHQVSSQQAGKPKGTGLGLPISQRIVERHGGTIRVESIEGEGACFIVELRNVPFDQHVASLLQATALPCDARHQPQHRFDKLRLVAVLALASRTPC